MAWLPILCYHAGLFTLTCTKYSGPHWKSDILHFHMQDSSTKCMDWNMNSMDLCKFTAFLTGGYSLGGNRWIWEIIDLNSFIFSQWKHDYGMFWHQLLCVSKLVGGCCEVPCF